MRLVETFALIQNQNSSFKNPFQEAFSVKVINTYKNTLHALNPLTNEVTKSNKYFNKPNPFSCRFV